MSDTPEDTDTIAPFEELCAVHRELARSFLTKMKEGKATAADLAAAVAYLRMNGVYKGGNLSPDDMGKAMRDLADQLPEFDDDGAAFTSDADDPSRIVSLR